MRNKLLISTALVAASLSYAPDAAAATWWSSTFENVGNFFTGGETQTVNDITLGGEGNSSTLTIDGGTEVTVAATAENEDFSTYYNNGNFQIPAEDVTLQSNDGTELDDAKYISFGEEGSETYYIITEDGNIYAATSDDDGQTIKAGADALTGTTLAEEGNKALAEVRGEIEALYQQQAAMQAFAEDAESFSNMVYEQSESLQPVAERYGLTIQTAKGITRDHQDSLLNPNVVEALYSFDVLEDKRNSNAIEVAANTLLSARVTAHHRQSVKPFDEVKNDILTSLKNRKATEAAMAQGEKDIAALKDKKAASVKFGEKAIVSRERPGAYAYEVVTAALRPQADKLPAYTGVQTPDGSYVVVEVQSAKKIEASPEQLAMRKAELAQLYSNPEQTAFISGLEQKFGAVILKDEYKPGYKPSEEENQH